MKRAPGRGARGLTRAAGVAGVVLLTAPAWGQISPGPLSRAHAKLDGSGKCLECHDPGQGVSSAKCLGCHKALSERVAAGKGLHARGEYRDCKRCHVEHQGADFDLVWWGKQGRAAFDHSQTGHVLGGKHAPLACEQCHKTRSFLGVVAACGSCHRDEHRGQFGGRACATCHGESAWKPAPGFDHAKTSWPLTGRHAPVGCEGCHKTRRPDPRQPGASYRVFRAVLGKDCASCHADVHNARLGSSCATCHTTQGWRGGKAATTAGFDHSRTAYPLRGRHAGVACERCHPAGRPLRVRHERCSDCHRDAHGGELARRADGGRCESCHDVAGFRPARFGPEEHAKTAYPLVGAHLAVACDQCHRPSAGVVRASQGGGTILPLRFASTRCSDCHKDPHRGETARVSGTAGCEGCHRVESWREVGFDHGKTGYALGGGHARVACAGCHRRGEGAAGAKSTGRAALAFAGAPRACAACHRDPHAGQFASAGRSAACDRCHTTDSLKASKFVHARDSNYALDGAHARLACAACHKAEQRGGVSVVRYKPLPTTCAGCHGPRGQATNVALGGRR